MVFIFSFFPYTGLLIHKHLKSIILAVVYDGYLCKFVRRHCIRWHTDSYNLHMHLNILHFGDSYDRCFHIRPGLFT